MDTLILFLLVIFLLVGGFVAAKYTLFPPPVLYNDLTSIALHTVAECSARFGKIDVVISNAAVQPSAGLTLDAE